MAAGLRALGFAARIDLTARVALDHPQPASWQRPAELVEMVVAHREHPGFDGYLDTGDRGRVASGSVIDAVLRARETQRTPGSSGPPEHGFIVGTDYYRGAAPEPRPASEVRAEGVFTVLGWAAPVPANLGRRRSRRSRS